MSTSPVPFHIKGEFVVDGILDVDQPESLVYEPMPNGRLRLVAVE